MSGDEKWVVEGFFGSLRSRRASWPDWLLSIERPNEEEQRAGADAVVVTKKRRILIRLEDSKSKIQEFNYFYPGNDIAVILLFPDFTANRIAQKSLDFIEREYQYPRALRIR